MIMELKLGVEVCIHFDEKMENYKYMYIIPRVGDTLELQSLYYKVIEVVFHIYDGTVDIYTELKE